MARYYQYVNLQQEFTATFRFIDAGENGYDMVINEGIIPGIGLGWLIQTNEPDDSWYASEADVQALGATEMTQDEFTAYFIPGSRPPHKPRP